jgi:hypothetical protein
MALLGSKLSPTLALGVWLLNMSLLYLLSSAPTLHSNVTILKIFSFLPPSNTTGSFFCQSKPGAFNNL